jgi:hypothetical protein
MCTSYSGYNQGGVYQFPGGSPLTGGTQIASYATCNNAYNLALNPTNGQIAVACESLCNTILTLWVLCCALLTSLCPTMWLPLSGYGSGSNAANAIMGLITNPTTTGATFITPIPQAAVL